MWAVVHGSGENMTAAIKNDVFKGTATQEHDGCDHTSTNALENQNSAVKRAWARVVLGWVTSWEVLVLHPSF